MEEQRQKRIYLASNLHQLTVSNLVKIFEGCWKQKYDKSYVNHIRERAGFSQRKNTFGEFAYDAKGNPITSPINNVNNIQGVLKGQHKWLKPHMKNYCSCILAYGLINYLICTDISDSNEANLSFFNNNILKFGNGYLINMTSCISDKQFHSIYAYFQSDIKETRRVDWESAVADCIPAFVDDYNENNKGQRLIICPLHDDTNPSLSINWLTNQWNCFGGCGIGRIPTLISKATGKFWHELKPNYLIGKAKQIDISPAEHIVPTKKLIDTEPLSNDHWVITERGFDWNHLTDWNCKQTSEGGLYLPYINKDGIKVGHIIRHSPEYLKLNPNAGKYMVKKGFSNSKELFGINRVTNTDILIIVEGSMDAIRLDYFGYSSVAVVATVSNGISQEQLELIKGLNPIEVCLAFDNDNTGREGLKRSANKLQETNLNVSFIEFRDKHKDFGDIKDKDIIDNYVTSRRLISEISNI